MIKSNYINFIDNVINDEVAFLIHGVTGAMDFIGGELYKWFKSDSSPKNLPNDIIERMLVRGYLWDGNTDDEINKIKLISSMLHKRRMAETVNSFWIIPTYRCNLRCYYCFQDHKIHRGEGLGQKDMSPDEAIQLINLFDAIGGAGPLAFSGRGRYITLFGGEPLMVENMETIKAIVREGGKKGYRIGAVTNGVDLINYESLLGRNAIRWVQVTLDGLSISNDKRRIPIRNDSFNRIIQGITVALNRGCKVSLRTNADFELAQQSTMLQNFADKMGWSKNSNFTWYMTPIETHANQTLSKVTIPVIDLIKNIQDSGSSTIKAPYFGKFNHLFKSLITDGISSNIETSACGAHTNMYFFDPNGLIYACAEQVGIPHKAIGKVSLEGNKFSLSKDNEWQLRHVGNMPLCSVCANAFFCGGGCANAAFEESNNFFAPRCNGIKDVLQYTSFKFAAKNWSEYQKYYKGANEYNLIPINTDEVLLSYLDPYSYSKNVN